MQIDPKIYEFSLSAESTFCELIAEARFDSNAVIPPNLILDSFATISGKLIYFHEETSSEDAVYQMNRLDLRPATLGELLCFASKFPELGRNTWVVALGTVLAVWGDSEYVPFIHGGPETRNLGYWRKIGGIYGERLALLAVAMREESTNST